MSTALKPYEDAVKAVATKYHHSQTDNSIKWAQEKIHALTIMRSSKKLQAAIPETIQTAILQAGSMGLTLNPQKKHCYLIPRSTKKGDPKAPIIAYASPSYMGLSHILIKEGMVRFIRAEVIYKGDIWKYKGPVDKPVYEGGDADRTNEGLATGAYAIAKSSDGDWLCEYMDRATIQRIRNMSEMPNGNIWSPDKMWTEGWKKAVIRRFCKTLPDAGIATTPRVDMAMQVMNENEGISNTTVETEIVRVINTDELTVLNDLIKEAGKRSDDLKKKVFEIYCLDSMDELPHDKFEECESRIKQALEAISG